MIRPAEAFRVVHIAWVLLRHGLDELILAAHLFRPIRFFRFLSPFYWLSRGDAAALRGAHPAQPGGPRADLREVRADPVDPPRPAARRCRRRARKLQDSVPPFPGAQARAIIEAAYGRPVTEVFAAFDQQPLASASIAQVHAARLRSGQEVVAKVLRPGVAPHHPPRHRPALHHRPPGPALLEGRASAPPGRGGAGVREDDLRRARPAARGRQLLAAAPQLPGRDVLYVPEVHWDYCRPESDGDRAGLRHAGRRGGAAARTGHQPEAARRARRRDLLHPGVPGQLLPRGHAPGQHLRRAATAATSVSTSASWAR